MKDFADLISALASLLWPVLVAFIFFILRPALIDLVDSAKRRKFTIKVGGQELTMDEANEQQQSLISDLQAQVIDLKNKLSLGTPGTKQTTDTIRSTIRKTNGSQAVLWVDDIPKNNSYLMQQLAQAGIKVDTALSTEEGINLFRKGNYSVIVSDMGRNETNGFNPSAGLDLLKAIRTISTDIPYVLYTGSRSYEEYKELALSQGATYITSSATDLAGVFRSAFGEDLKV